MLDFHIYQSVVTVQRNFRREFGVQPPSGPSMRKWYVDFKMRGCLCKRKSTVCPPLSETNVVRVRKSFRRSPQISLKNCVEDFTETFEVPTIPSAINAGSDTR